MKSKIVFLAASISACGIRAFGQQDAPILPPQPHLFRLWTDASGESHIKEIKLGNNKRPMIPGITMNFSGTPAGPNARKFHHSPAHQFAVTVSGKIDVEASDGSKAHLERRYVLPGGHYGKRSQNFRGGRRKHFSTRA
jgi:hypothetical protein